MSTLQHDSITNPKPASPQANPQPATPHAHWLGWASLTLACAALVLSFLGDPYWLALPTTLLGALAGHLCIRLGHDQHVGAQIGKNLGLFNLFFWFLLVVLVPLTFGTPTTSLFQIPSYN